ncbi:hypothetical protein R1sor_008244 [Riccia sorocarpa]|uniref:Uncharacterized protein n=1 Tax=Riccia sorocarpa TaxID=122646 RepID=A0ABD3HSU5_9MARC
MDSKGKSIVNEEEEHNPSPEVPKETLDKPSGSRQPAPPYGDLPAKFEKFCSQFDSQRSKDIPDMFSDPESVQKIQFATSLLADCLMARVKQTARKVPVPKPGKRIVVDASEVTFCGGQARTGQVTLQRLPNSSAQEQPSSSNQQQMTQRAATTWPRPSDFSLEKIDVHTEEHLEGWVVDYMKRARLSTPEIVLKLKVVENEKEKTKEMGIVCHSFRKEDGLLEVWWEYLKNKSLRKSILPMAKLDTDQLTVKDGGGLRDFRLEEEEGDISPEDFSSAVLEVRMDLGSTLQSDATQKEASTSSRSPERKQDAPPPKKQKKPAVRIEEPEGSKKKKNSSVATTQQISIDTSSAKTQTALRPETSKRKKTAEIPATRTISISTSSGNTQEAVQPDTSKKKKKVEPRIPAVLDNVPAGPEEGATPEICTEVIAVKQTSSSRESDLQRATVDANPEHGTKRKAQVKLEKAKGFQPESAIVGQDQDANVSMFLDPNNNDQIRKEWEDLQQWFPLKNQLVWCHIAQLTDPLSTMVLHGRNQYKALGSPERTKKGYSKNQKYNEFLERLKVTFNMDNVKHVVWICTASDQVFNKWLQLVDLWCQGVLPDGKGIALDKRRTRSASTILKSHFRGFIGLDSEDAMLKILEAVIDKKVLYKKDPECKLDIMSMDEYAAASSDGEVHSKDHRDDFTDGNIW